jgi:hypothetical protein
MKIVLINNSQKKGARKVTIKVSRIRRILKSKGRKEREVKKDKEKQSPTDRVHLRHSALRNYQAEQASYCEVSAPRV